MAEAVELESVSKLFDKHAALADVSLTIRRSEFLSILGPSGCGKTTTLNVIAGFVQPTVGRVLIEGDDMTECPPYLRGLGMVFQSYALFPHMDVFENVAFGLKVRRAGRQDIRRRVAEVLGLVQLSGLERRKPRQLSGGEQQRVALARAMVTQPKVLLLEEPLAALDKKLRDEMRLELKDIQRRTGITTVFVTHDQVEALSLSDRVVVMNGGRIEQVGSPRELYETPASSFVAGFVGESNRFAGRVVRLVGDAACVAVDGLPELWLDAAPGFLPGQQVELVIRPERLDLQQSPNGERNVVHGQLQTSVYLGSSLELRIAVGGHRLVARIGPGHDAAGLTPGSDVCLWLDPRHLKAFA